MTSLGYNAAVGRQLSIAFVRRGIVPALITLGVLAGCASDPPPSPGEFIAIERDFESFDEWTMFDRGSQPVGPSHPDGSTLIYINRLPSPASTQFSTGTIIVRVTPAGAPELWEVHAMVKRGGEYNAAGARGWEFFDLLLETVGDDLVPRIRWRGEGPAMGDGYTIPDGGVVLSCNHCHASAIENDSVLDPDLDLRSF